VTGTIFGAGTAAAVVVTSAADAAAVQAGPSANYPDYYHGLSRQQRSNLAKTAPPKVMCASLANA
jgi:hypothetical protein